MKTISAASAHLKSNTKAEKIYPKGSKTISIVMTEEQAAKLATCLLSVVHDRNWQGEGGKIIITGHEHRQSITVFRRD
jgi:hypothetical protein